MTDIERLELLAFRAGFVRGVAAALQYAMVEDHPENLLKCWALEVAAWHNRSFVAEPPPELVRFGEVLQ